MKKLIYFLMLLPALLIWQCKDNDYPPVPAPDVSLKFHDTTLVMSTAGGNTTITLQSTKDWALSVEYPAAETNKNWLTVDQESGTMGGNIAVTVTAASSSVEREATLVLSQTGENPETPARLVVKQSVNGFSVEKTRYPVGYEQSEVEVKFLTNVASYGALANDEWIELIPSGKATSTGSFKFSVRKNLDPVERTGSVTIYDQEGVATPVTVSIVQAASPVEGTLVYTGTNALGAVLMSDGSKYTSWVLRQDPKTNETLDQEHLWSSGWYYAIPCYASGVDGIFYGNEKFNFGAAGSSIAVKFNAETQMMTLCYGGSNNVTKMYPWNTDYATTVAQAPIVDATGGVSGGWTYFTGNAANWYPSGEYLVVITQEDAGGYVDVADYATYPKLEPVLNGVKCFIDGKAATKVVSLSYVAIKDKTQPKMALGRSTVKGMTSADAKAWQIKDEYSLNYEMIKDDPKETGEGVLNPSTYGFAKDVAAVKIGSTTFMALSDGDKTWIASTDDGKQWSIVKEDLGLAGKVSSIIVKDGTLYFYYVTGSSLHVATATSGANWYASLSDQGEALAIPSGATTGTMAYNETDGKFQFIYVASTGGSIRSLVSASATGSFEDGGLVLEKTSDGSDKAMYITDGQGHITSDSRIAYRFKNGIYLN